MADSLSRWAQLVAGQLPADERESFYRTGGGRRMPRLIREWMGAAGGGPFPLLDLPGVGTLDETRPERRPC